MRKDTIKKKSHYKHRKIEPDENDESHQEYDSKIAEDKTEARQPSRILIGIFIVIVLLIVIFGLKIYLFSGYEERDVQPSAKDADGGDISSEGGDTQSGVQNTEGGISSGRGGGSSGGSTSGGSGGGGASVGGQTSGSADNGGDTQEGGQNTEDRSGEGVKGYWVTCTGCQRGPVSINYKGSSRDDCASTMIRCYQSECTNKKALC
ncbi:hypothetical protein FJZ53_04140 [Candidatus Woesearchaeota archaeon]|nr:hypothetical protein [Candidatus Woesearchaeota archaeon]